jgi:hypothetical protein
MALARTAGLERRGDPMFGGMPVNSTGSDIAPMAYRALQP